MKTSRCPVLRTAGAIIIGLFVLAVPKTSKAQAVTTVGLVDPGTPLNIKLRDAAQHGRLLEARHLMDEGANVETIPYLRDLYNSEISAPPDDAVSPLVTIKLPEHVLLGETVPIHIEFTNNTDITSFFNPRFNRLESSPAGILLFDEHKRIIGDLFDFDSFSGSHTSARTYETIEKGHVLKIDELFKIPTDGGITSIPSRLILSNTNDAESHRYYVQLIYWFRYLIPPPPFDPTHGPSDLWRLPLFRSNLVPIQIDGPKTESFSDTLSEILKEDSDLKFKAWWHDMVEEPHYENDRYEWVGQAVGVQDSKVVQKKLDDMTHQRDALAEKITGLENEIEALKKNAH